MKPSPIYYSREDHAFGCYGCFDRMEIPQHVNDPEKIMMAKEALGQMHRKRGCMEKMKAMERPRGLRLVWGLG